MASAHGIRLKGVVIEVKSEKVVLVKLANGHRLFAHGSRANAGKVTVLVPGSVVMLEMSPADMSRGRLRFEEKR